MQQYCIIMQTKSKRLALIQELVSQNQIKTQNELQALLNERGYRVNQATLSRDIKELRLLKATIEGIQQYVIESSIPTTTTTTTKPVEGLSRFVLGIEISRNIIVIKTDVGAANHVAKGLDSLELKEIIGTVAGDDTIIAVASESAKMPEIKSKLNSLFSLS